MNMEMNDSDASAPPSREQLLAVLDQLTGLSDEDREDLRQHLLSENQPKDVPVEPTFTSQFFILVSFMAIVAAIFVFFGYKLYKSLKDKERKRDEKKKLRQQKKKK